MNFFKAVLCVCIALIPEAVMWGVYSTINPESTIEIIATWALFWFAGAGFCVLFACLGVIIYSSIQTTKLQRIRARRKKS